MPRHFLVVIDAAPFCGEAVIETIELAMGLAAFDNPVSVLFKGAGVFNLSANLRPDLSGQHDATRLIPALHYYDINSLWVVKEDLPNAFHFAEGLRTRSVSRQDLATFSADFNQVIFAG